ncbi:MAG: cell division ATP-binding protein FtsE [Hellea sp.]|nr:cell division ATP-binding protein FtsE [Hellea sp.]
MFKKKKPKLKIALKNEVVRFERLGMRYGRGPEILSDVDMCLQNGSFTFLTGPSGAGKSTLLKLCYLELKQSRGLISLFGTDISKMSRKAKHSTRKKIGVILQDFRLIDHLTIFENVALPLRVSGEKKSNYTKDVSELLQWVGLGARMDALPKTLSGGEKQRAAIARAVISKPDLIIADEPTGNVDEVMSKRLLSLFTEMNRSGTTVLIATHNKKLIKGVKANILHIENGILIDTSFEPST